MPKVSFRMASASRESVFGVQTSTARKIIGQGHRGPVDHDAKQMLRTERNRCRHTVASSPSREHWPRAVCRNTGSVMCGGLEREVDRATLRLSKAASGGGGGAAASAGARRGPAIDVSMRLLRVIPEARLLPCGSSLIARLLSS